MKWKTGKKSWVKTLQDFYSDFDEELTEAEEAMDGKRIKVPDEETDQVCELCGKPMVIKIGRYGKFMACSGFPECKNTKKIVQETGGICLTAERKCFLKSLKRARSITAVRIILSASS